MKRQAHITERLDEAASRVARHCLGLPTDRGLVSMPPNDDDIDALCIVASDHIRRLEGQVSELQDRIWDLEHPVVEDEAET